jgi:TPR repeat protein
MYRQGLGVPQDFAEAARWSRIAAEQGYAAAQFNVGLMYDRGVGLPQDFTEAVRWYRRAAEEGMPAAQNNLGRMYYEGKGLAQDYVQAHMWLNLAASSAAGDQQKISAASRDSVAGKMTSEQIALAQRLASAWKPKTGQRPKDKP